MGRRMKGQTIVTGTRRYRLRKRVAKATPGNVVGGVEGAPSAPIS